MGNRFNILSLSGGGYLGLYTISVIAELEKSFGGPIARHFDLIAGTSVGGIIALALAAEIPAADIQKKFEIEGVNIFSDRPAPIGSARTWFDIKRFMFKPKYSHLGLKKAITDIVGADKKIKDIPHRVIIPAVNLTKGAPQVFKTPHHPNFKTDLHLNVVDVALATSAAPTFFPLAEINDMLYADGGLYANSPDLLAVHEAEHFLAQHRNDIHLLSIGTTSKRFSFAHEHGKNLGLLEWAREQRLVNVAIASQQQSVDFIMMHQLDNRYLRLDADQSKEQERHLALDVATKNAQKNLRGIASATVQGVINSERLVEFFKHTPSKPTFYNIQE